MLRFLFLVVGSVIVFSCYGAEETPEDVPVLTPEQLEHYRFEDDPEAQPVTVEELSVGQKFILDSQRRDIKDLIERELGIMKLKGTREDLDVIQRLVEREVLRDDQIKEWQSVGILLGDILAGEYDLHWVSYEDERGESKALQWRDTLNFVFPITVFSKRVEFGQPIDVKRIYEEITGDIENFEETKKAGGRIRT